MPYKGEMALEEFQCQAHMLHTSREVNEQRVFDFGLQVAIGQMISESTTQMKTPNSDDQQVITVKEASFTGFSNHSFLL